MERFARQEITFAELAAYLLPKATGIGFDLSQAEQSVVYKIRRPNMDTTLGSDYRALDAVATELRGESFKGETISSVDELVETVKEWVELEKDFRYEAEFHELLSDLDYTWADTFAEEAEVTITHPKVYFATERLIVEEEIQGVPLLSLAEQQNPITMEDVLDAGYTMPAAQQTFNRLQDEDVRRAHILLSLKRSGYPENELEDLADELEAYDYNKLRGLLRQMLLRQIFVDGIFHADLHQGNVIFTPDGRLAMIDRGNVGKLNTLQINGVKTLLKGLSLRQSDTIKSGIDAIFLGTKHADGRTATFAGITRDEVQDILDAGHDLKMTMSLIGARTVQGTARTQAEQDFSKFLKAFTQAIWLFPTDFSNGVGSLEAIAQYAGMTEEEAVSAAEEQAKYFVVQDTTPQTRGRDSDLMQVARRILDEKLAATGNPITRLVLRAIVFPLIRRSIRSAEVNPTALTGSVIGQVRSLGPRVIRDNIETIVELRNFELLDAVGEMLTVPIAENIMSSYMETSLRGRGYGSRSLG
ncbi:MAG: phosphotransferase, partial [Candidatus Omnitrophica bacterium]|nr:phosphotransferase [Candidatus Omnitrophota bacterium]